MKIKDLIVNKVYNNKEITQTFKCGPQGGMRKSNTTNSLVLISNHTGSSIYGDKWIDGKIHYTGMGLKGDQRLDFMQNKTLLESNSNGVSVYLFEVFKKTEYTYAGEVKLSGPPYQEQEKDSEGNKRLVYRFPLTILDENYLPVKSVIEDTDKIREHKFLKKDSDEITELAMKNNDQNKGKVHYRYVKTPLYERDPFIKEYVLNLADGVCQLCEQMAPFEVDGRPYLKIHNITPLSEGGDDTINNSIALCPNCQARVQKLNLDKDRKKLIEKIRKRHFS